MTTPEGSITHLGGWLDMMNKSPAVDWLIGGVLPSGCRAMLYAVTGVGKSFTLLDIGLHVATGKDWQGHKVKQGRVYYIASENSGTIPERLQAWAARHKPRVSEAFPIEFYGGVDLTSPTSVDALLAQLHEARLVVVDTLLASLGNGDIKEQRDIGRVVAQMNRIIQRTGATVLLANHAPDSNKAQPMGGAAMRANVQVILRLTRQRDGRVLGEKASFQDGDVVKLVCEKLTQAEQFAPISIPIELVSVKGCDKPVPVLTAPQAKRAIARRVAGGDGMSFDEAYAQVGDDRPALERLTRMTQDAIRQRLSRLNRGRRESAQCHAA